MRPPCSSTIFFAIASPSPVPPFLRVLELSTCWNSSKIRCWSLDRNAGAGVGDGNFESAVDGIAP